MSALLLLSGLSEHTRELMGEPRCALIAVGQPDGPNPQTAPRATLTGRAAPVPPEETAALKARYLARRPYARMYAEFADFTLWRVSPAGGNMSAALPARTGCAESSCCPIRRRWRLLLLLRPRSSTT